MNPALVLRVKTAVYRHFADTGHAPWPAEIARRTGLSADEIQEAYRELRAQRLLLFEPDGRTIRMAPPFSGVPTQHVVLVGEKTYFANCAWDALGVVAALQSEGRVRSRCELSLEPLDLHVGLDGPEPSNWLFHCLVPASKWWDNLVFT